MAANTKYLTETENFNATLPANASDSWTVYGGQGINSITMNSNGGTVYGYAGADAITVSGGATVYGGNDGDSVSVVTGNNTVNGDAGSDTINVASAGINTVNGGDLGDTINVEATAVGNSTYNGDAGDDTINVAAGANGNNSFNGGAGNDDIIFTGAVNGNNTIFGGTGNDDITLSATSTGVNTIGYNSGDGADTVTNFDWAGADKDKVSFGYTAAELAGATYSFTASPGADGVGTVTITFATGKTVTLDGLGLTGNTIAQVQNAFAKTSYAATRDAFVTSDSGKLVYVDGTDASAASTAGAYVLGLNAGGNTLTYNATAIKYIGGAGTDIVTAAAATSAVTLDLNDSTKYSSVEQAVGSTTVGSILRGSTGDNTLTGGNLADQLWGRAGNDTLAGGTGDDTFYFGSGEGNDIIDDLLVGQADVVKLYNVAKGGFTVSNDGTDTTITLAADSSTLILDDGEAALAAGSAVRFTLSDGTVAKISAAGGTMNYASDVQYYYSQAAAGKVDATAATAGVTISLYDTAKYKNVADATGSAFADVLRGTNYAANTLVGLAGADQLWGGTGGSDVMTGGDDADTFYFGSTDGQDTITDYAAADTIKLWNLAAAGVAGVTYTDADTFTLNLTGNVADSLIVNSAAVNTLATFQLQNGSTFKVAQNGTYVADAAYYSTAVAALNASADTAGVTINLYDTVKYGTSFDTVTSGSGNDTLRGRHNDDETLDAGNGNNALWGGIGGTDIMTAGTGTDTYYWGRADGNDTVTAGSDSKDKVLLYTSGMTSSNVTIGVAGAVLTLTSDAGNTLTVNNWTVGGTNTFVFGYSSTSDNTYKISQTASGYAWEKVSA